MEIILTGGNSRGRRRVSKGLREKTALKGQARAVAESMACRPRECLRGLWIARP